MNGSRDSRGGDRADSRSGVTDGEAYVTLGAKLTRRPLFMGSMLGLTALAVGAGLSFRGYLSNPGAGHIGLEHSASAAGARPATVNTGLDTSKLTAPATDHPPGTPTQSTPSAPPPDPRVERALDTRVHLQAGKAASGIQLRRLGVSLRWPEAGEPEWTIDERLFNRAIRRLGRRVEHLPLNARMIHDKSGFRPVSARPGRLLDRAEARKQLQAALTAPAFRQSLEAKPVPISLTLRSKEVQPKLTANHLGSINTLLAAFSTSLGASSRNRRHNIQVACQAIDGTVLMPGEVFSYNETVGPRSERAGFRTAPVIIRGELVPGTGGGVCQVSSTLYNLALLGGLKIVRRSHHQFPVHYVPPGRDATVAYGSLDLRFANSLSHPVALDVKTAGSRVNVHLYGWADCKRDVRLVSSRVTWTRPRAPAGGGPARPGKRVTVSRIVRLPDGEERHEVISHDSYAPAPASAHSRTGLGHHFSHRRTHSHQAAAARQTRTVNSSPPVQSTSAKDAR